MAPPARAGSAVGERPQGDAAPAQWPRAVGFREVAWVAGAIAVDHIRAGIAEQLRGRTAVEKLVRITGVVDLRQRRFLRSLPFVVPPDDGGLIEVQPTAVAVHHLWVTGDLPAREQTGNGGLG